MKIQEIVMTALLDNIRNQMLLKVASYAGKGNFLLSLVLLLCLYVRLVTQASTKMSKVKPSVRIAK